MEGLFPPQDVSSSAEVQEATATSKLLNELNEAHDSTDTSESGGIENLPNDANGAPPAPHHGLHELMGETLTGWAGGTSTNATDHRHL
jgi:hypothetical protein